MTMMAMMMTIMMMIMTAMMMMAMRLPQTTVTTTMAGTRPGHHQDGALVVVEVGLRRFRVLEVLGLGFGFWRFWVRRSCFGEILVSGCFGFRYWVLSSPSPHHLSRPPSSLPSPINSPVPHRLSRPPSSRPSPPRVMQEVGASRRRLRLTQKVGASGKRFRVMQEVGASRRRFRPAGRAFLGAMEIAGARGA